MLLRVLLRDGHHLHAAEVEPLGLEPRDDGADEAALDAVRLDHDVRLLHGEFRKCVRARRGR